MYCFICCLMKFRAKSHSLQYPHVGHTAHHCVFVETAAPVGRQMAVSQECFSKAGVPQLRHKVCQRLPWSVSRMSNKFCMPGPTGAIV